MFDAAPPAIGGACRADGTWEFGRKASCPNQKAAEKPFKTRLVDLPDETRMLLLIAALNDRESTGEILQAAAFAVGRGIDLDGLEPPARAGLIELDVNYVRFRHPLMRSAVRQAGPIEHRRRAHNALAQALTDDPDRRVWRRAALIGGTHEHVAAELEQTGRRARRRGAISVAATAMRRAAEFCGPAQRARRLVAAAELTFELGQLNVVVTLLREVELLSPGPVERARAAWIDEMINLRAPSPTWATALIAVAEQAGAAGDHGLHFSLLWRVATRFWWARACSRLSAIQTVGLLPTPASTCATCARASSTRPTCIAASARFEMIGGGGRGRSRAHRRKCGAPTSSSRWRSAGESPLRSDEVRVLAIQAYADPFRHASTGCHTHVYRIYSKLWTALASA